MNQVRTILRNATRKKGDPLNIITYVTHERYEDIFCKFDHTFWAVRVQGAREWVPAYGKMPPNYHTVDRIPPWIDPDLILSQNIGVHFQPSLQIAKQYRIPIINLWHVLPPPDMSRKVIQNNMRYIDGVSAQVFISDYNKKAWGWGDTNAKVIKHCVNTEFWHETNKQRKPVVLSVCNDWINRDWACGFTLWRNTIGLQTQSQLPVRVIGNTPGFSAPAKDQEELRDAYSESMIFLNTSLHSPIPTVVLEAMACGCCVVSTNTCMLPEVITHGYDGILVDPDPQKLRAEVVRLLQNPSEAKRLGENAKKTIAEKFAVSTFIDSWNEIFYGVIGDA